MTATTMQCLDLVLGEWLSNETATTLVEPKQDVVSFCCVGTTATDVSCLRVEVFGSGVVLVPSFAFNCNTTAGLLFNCVENVVSAADNAESIVRLFYQKHELFDDQGGAHSDDSKLMSGYNICDGAVVFAVVVATQKALDRRT